MNPNNKSKENLSGKEDKDISKISPKKTETTRHNLEDDPFAKIKQKTDEAIKDSFDFAINASHKIDENIKEGIQKTKESSIFQEVKEKTNQLRRMDQKEKNKHKRKVTRALTRIRNTIFEFFEKFVGRIRIGTQYGKSSIDLLSDLAKLKELGIITEKEFELKKKEILDRI